MANIKRSAEELHATLVSQAEVELMRAQLRYEEYVNDLNSARIVRQALGEDNDDLLLGPEKTLLEEDKTQEMLKKVEFWERRLQRLRNYDIDNFR